MPILSLLPEDQKPARIQGLLTRLFVSYLYSSKFTKTEQAQIAALFEQVLLNHYEKKAQTFVADLATLFENAPHGQEKINRIQQKINAVLKELNTPKENFYMMEAGTRSAFEQKVQAIQAIKVVDQTTQLLKAFRLAIHQAIDGIPLVLTKHLIKIFGPFQLLDPVRGPALLKGNITPEGNFQLLSQLLTTPNYFETHLQANEEKRLFNVGLMDQEIKPLIQDLALAFNNLAKNEKLIQAFNAIKHLPNVEARYLQLEQEIAAFKIKPLSYDQILMQAFEAIITHEQAGYSDASQYANAQYSNSNNAKKTK